MSSHVITNHRISNGTIFNRDVGVKTVNITSIVFYKECADDWDEYYMRDIDCLQDALSSAASSYESSCRLVWILQSSKKRVAYFEETLQTVLADQQ